MKWKKIMVVGVIVVVTNLTTWFLSSHTIVWGANHLPAYVYDDKTELSLEREYCGCMMEMLHDYWEFKDVEYNDEGDIISKHNFWNDVIMETEAYQKADSLNNGDWEDFPFHWYTEDDCCHEK